MKEYEHECIIGMFYDSGDTRLITLKSLLKNIDLYMTLYEDTKDVYKAYWKDRRPYTLKDYCDKRKNTNLTRFEFCPMCGKKINWKKMKEENNTK